MEAMQSELINLWTDLDLALARQSALCADGWSAHAIWVRERIEALTLLVGPVDIREIPPEVADIARGVGDASQTRDAHTEAR